MAGGNYSRFCGSNTSVPHIVWQLGQVHPNHFVQGSLSMHEVDGGLSLYFPCVSNLSPARAHLRYVPLVCVVFKGHMGNPIAKYINYSLELDGHRPRDFDHLWMTARVRVARMGSWSLSAHALIFALESGYNLIPCQQQASTHSLYTRRKYGDPGLTRAHGTWHRLALRPVCSSPECVTHPRRASTSDSASAATASEPRSQWSVGQYPNSYLHGPSI